jgi:hypothetical protein
VGIKHKTVMSNNIGRNEKCTCGSGKKFKKCCLFKQNNLSQIESKFESINFLDNINYIPNNISQIESKFNSINFQDHINYTPQKKSQLLYVVNSSDLPNDISQIINRYVKNEKLIRGGCWYNSSHLSLIDERVKIVHGYYGERMTKQEYETNSYKMKTTGTLLNNDGWYPFEDEYGKGFYDLKNKTTLSPHSWNQFGDIHFDLTKENDSLLKNEWINYYPIKTESTSSFDLQTKTDLIKMVINRKSYRDQIN